MTRARTALWIFYLPGLFAGCSVEAPAAAPQPVASCRVSPFDDVTDSLGVDFVHHPRPDPCDVTNLMGPGACMIDYDRDGDIDLYFVDRSPHPNRLYRNDGARFTDVTEASGAGDTHDGVGCLTLDYDGDGDEDLYLTNFDGNRMYRNDGGRFADVTEAAGLRSEGMATSATAGDIDGDGDLDLFVARLFNLADLPHGCLFKIEGVTPLTNMLFVNQGGRFTEESAARGLPERDPSMAVKFFDLDTDGDLDLYVGNDNGRSYPDRFYLNDGHGHFHDGAPAMGLDHDGSGNSGDTMGIDLDDIDLDGVPELVSSSTNGDPMQLYHCDRALHCAAVSEAWGLRAATPSFKWGLGLEDFDLDGDLDLFVANGASFEPTGQRNQLFWNVGGRFIVHPTTDDEALASVQSSRAALFGDLDGDHAIDVVVTNVGARPQVLRNRAGCGHWIEVRVVPPVVGTRVRVTSGGHTLERQVSLSGSYLGSNSRTLHFGLGLTAAASLEVRWPGGRVLRRDPAPVDQVLTVR